MIKINQDRQHQYRMVYRSRKCRLLIKTAPQASNPNRVTIFRQISIIQPKKTTETTESKDYTKKSLHIAKKNRLDRTAEAYDRAGISDGSAANNAIPTLLLHAVRCRCRSKFTTCSRPQ